MIPIARYVPPVRDRRFWNVQLLVLLIASAHDLIEVGGILPQFGALYFIPISLFFIPVVYAALNFGLRGSVATALWATVITLPNWVFWRHGYERWGVILQMAIVDSVGVFVGQRVDMESSARTEAETIGAAPERLRGYGLEPLLATSRTLRPLQVGERRSPHDDLVLRQPSGRIVHLRPVESAFVDQVGEKLTQLILLDVTEQRWREEGLRSYAAQILQAQEEERRRIAQELHDETVQSLVSVCRKLDEIEKLAGRNDGERRSLVGLVGQVSDTREEVTEIAEALRRITRGLRPSILDDLGLVAAVRRLVADLDERTNVEVAFATEGRKRRLDPTVELGIYRIAQEALRNAERHSRASRVEVCLRFGSDRIELVVKDDGKGFRRPEPGEKNLAAFGRLGLVGMGERARLMKGSFEVRSRPGQGTTITARVPTDTSLCGYRGVVRLIE